jgi:HAD superfamily hydrolase (TIGR01549 family)
MTADRDSRQPDLAVFDVDGTLVDSNYHHVIAWARAFRRFDVTVQNWRVHRSIGMGGDRLVEHVAGEDVERRLGDDLRSANDEEYQRVMGEVLPFAPARDLLLAVRKAGLQVVLASSGKQYEVDHNLDLLDARSIAEVWTSSDDAGESKPAPDILQVAIDKVGGGTPVMVGDSVWDVEAANRIDVPTVCVRTGGFGADELREAGAAEVWESLEELMHSLDRSLLGGGR